MESSTIPGFDALLKAVLSHIDHEELVQLTRYLVRIPSIYRPEEPDGNEYRAALNVRLTEKEIEETVIQTVPYAGFPTAINAMNVFKEVLAESGKD